MAHAQWEVIENVPLPPRPEIAAGVAADARVDDPEPEPGVESVKMALHQVHVPLAERVFDPEPGLRIPPTGVSDRITRHQKPAVPFYSHVLPPQN